MLSAAATGANNAQNAALLPPQRAFGSALNLSLIHIFVLSILFYRPFCKWLCPLGAFYALFNRCLLYTSRCV